MTSCALKIDINRRQMWLKDFYRDYTWMFPGRLWGFCQRPLPQALLFGSAVLSLLAHRRAPLIAGAALGHVAVQYPNTAGAAWWAALTRIEAACSSLTIKLEERDWNSGIDLITLVSIHTNANIIAIWIDLRTILLNLWDWLVFFFLNATEWLIQLMMIHKAYSRTKRRIIIILPA